MAILFTSTQQKIEIEDKSFGKGGEGSVHKIVSPASLKDSCVKLYSEKYRTLERQNKIEFMVKNKPSKLNGNFYMLCWPTEIVFDTTGRFYGFVLPLAWQNSIKLYSLCLSDKVNPYPTWLNKFARQSSQEKTLQLKLIVNIAVAVHSIHSLNKYVFVDMKPENILVTEEAKIAIIDLDSVQIAENKKVQFHAQVATPEFSPPEAINLKDNYIPIDWDKFSLAVIFYKLLFGIHPFTATFKGSYQHITETKDAVKNSLFVNGYKWRYVSILPHPHNDFSTIDTRLKELFKLAFDNEIHEPRLRPSAEDWGRTAHDIINNKTKNITFLNEKTENMLKNRMQTIKGLL
jgi:DNA-binding helix-hairpin-helix protein with protein kinase domain